MARALRSIVTTHWRTGSTVGSPSRSAAELFPEELFLRMLCIERDRAERSERQLVLMLVDVSSLFANFPRAETTTKLVESLSDATRATDIQGWYQDGGVLGVILTEIPLEEKAVVEALRGRITSVLQSAFGVHALGVRLNFHVFPEDPDNSRGVSGSHDAFETIYPDLLKTIEARRFALIAKRCIDIAGSLVALIVLAPLMTAIAIAIKIKSPGPVLFRQIRLGRSGKPFMFLKFRSMHVQSNPAIHEAYVKSFIANKAKDECDAGGKAVFKLQGDPRVTGIGRFLRRTSLDELPQFFSVLTGDMSLVGPRPPVPYEFAAYKIWHRRRLLAVRPGITGLWQVEGRSRVKFDEMVRMDIAYVRRWTLWKDITILMRTPKAVVSGSGAC